MTTAVQPMSNTAPPLSAPVSSTSNSGLAGGDFETFLRMLTTQIRNQDPLNPMEGSDFAVQLATFSGVEQQVRANTFLEAIAGTSGASGIGQYVPWIGREVRSPSSAWFDGTPLPLEVMPDPAADSVVLVVNDASGRTVSREEIGPGNGTVEWFGHDDMGTPLPAGQYSFVVESWKGDQLLARDMAETYSRVTAVETGPSGVELILGGGGRVLASEASALREGSL